MKRAELTVGQVVEDKTGTTYVVVDTGGWRKWGGYRVDATGVEHDGVPVLSSAHQVDVSGRVGVLVVGEWQIRRNEESADTRDTTLTGEAKLPQHLYPEGHAWAVTKARRAAFEERADADLKFDQEMLKQVRDLWGDKADEVLSLSRVIPDDGLFTDREREALTVIIVCGRLR